MPSRLHSRFAPIACSILLLGGCAETAPPTPTPTVDTLTSGRIVVANPDPTTITPVSTTVTELVRIGALEGDGPDVFGRIGDVEIGPTGAIWVLDTQAEEVRAFAPDGRHLGTVGGSGQGPGELSSPAGMTFDEDGRLVVMDWQNARWSFFDPELLAPAGQARRVASFASFPWQGGAVAGGGMVDIGLDAEGEPAILFLDSTFTPVDTLPTPVPDPDTRIEFRRDGRMMMSMTDPFAPRPLWTVHPAGGVALGEGAAWRIHHLSPEGDTLRTIELARAPVPVPAAMRDTALAEIRRTITEMGVEPNRPPRAFEVLPAHGPLSIDDRGRWWVRTSTLDGDRTAWDVLDPEGRWLATVELPVLATGAGPAVRGDLVAVGTSVDGVPGVAVFRVEIGER